MSIVQHEIPDARVLDLFAGTGALGLEALSRGAAFCDFVDSAEVALRTVRANVATLGAALRCDTHRADAVAFVAALTGTAYDLAFADPPYHQGFAARLAELWLVRPFAQVFGVEHGVDEVMPAGGTLKKYAGTGVTVFRSPSPAALVSPSSHALSPTHNRS